MTSIYEAEIRGKPRAKTVEDQLTSRVFGALDTLHKHDVLVPFLRYLVLDDPDGVIEEKLRSLASELEDLSEEESGRITISLWKPCGDSCPDVDIEIPSKRRRIVIEVKKDSPADPDQMVKQYRNARGKNKQCSYFLLTNDKDKPSEIETAKEELQKEIHSAIIYWRKWRQVWKQLTDLSKNQRETVSKSLLDATIKLLEVREMNIKGPTGFKREWFKKEISNTLDTVQELYREVSITMEDVKRELQDKEIEYLASNPDLKNRQQLGSLDELIPRSPEFYFKDEKWTEVKDKDTDPNIFISFGLEAETDNLGPSVALYWNHHLENDAINEIRENAEREGFDFEYQDETLYVYNNPELKKLHKGAQAVNTLVEKLVELRDFTNKLEILHEALGLKSTRISRKRDK